MAETFYHIALPGNMTLKVEVHRKDPLHVILDLGEGGKQLDFSYTPDSDPLKKGIRKITPTGVTISAGGVRIDPADRKPYGNSVTVAAGTVEFNSDDGTRH